MNNQINFKIPVSERHKKWIAEQVERWAGAEARIREKAEKDIQDVKKLLDDYINFWNNNEKPIYEQLIRHLDTSKSYETKVIWKDLGSVYVTTLTSANGRVCQYCEQTPGEKHIRCSDSRYDNSFYICDCDGARQNGKHYSELK